MLYGGFATSVRQNQKLASSSFVLHLGFHETSRFFSFGPPVIRRKPWLPLLVPAGQKRPEKRRNCKKLGAPNSRDVIEDCNVFGLYLRPSRVVSLRIRSPLRNCYSIHRCLTIWGCVCVASCSLLLPNIGQVPSVPERRSAVASRHNSVR